MSSTSTNAPGMQEAANLMADARTTATRGVETVRDQATALYGTWVGEAGEFWAKGAIDKWIQLCDSILGRLNTISHVMADHGVEIKNTEEINKDVAREAAAGIGGGAGSPLPL